jgi:hypothetical protein
MTTTRTAKRKATRFHLCPEEPFMWRKKTRCTMICTMAAVAMPADTVRADTVWLITIQNGIAVRTNARTSPVI